MDRCNVSLWPWSWLCSCQSSCRIENSLFSDGFGSILCSRWPRLQNCQLHRVIGSRKCIWSLRVKTASVSTRSISVQWWSIERNEMLFKSLPEREFAGNLIWGQGVVPQAESRTEMWATETGDRICLSDLNSPSNVDNESTHLTNCRVLARRRESRPRFRGEFKCGFFQLLAFPATFD